MRIFVPVTGRLLAEWVTVGSLGGLSTGHCVTPALRREYGEGSDEEELEYIALVEASLACLELLAGADSWPARRIVLALDLEMAVAPGHPGRYLSTVQIPHTVPLERVVSVHVDDDDAVPAVRRAVAAVATGTPEVATLVDDVAEFDLMWFDATELGQVVSSLGDPG